MSKPAKPLKDIRYFESADVPGLGRPRCSAGIKLPIAVHRIGQRIACLLHAEKFSVGSYDHVYISFTPALKSGQVAITDFGMEHWQRYSAFGISPDFNTLAEDEKLRFVEAATFAVLRMLSPDQVPILESVVNRLNETGARTRVLLSAKDTKAYRFEVWFDVPPWGETSYLYLTTRNNASGDWLAAPPVPLKDFEDAFCLVSSISCVGGIVTLKPRTSFRAKLTTKAYRTPIRIPLAKFVPVGPAHAEP